MKWISLLWTIVLIDGFLQPNSSLGHKLKKRQYDTVMEEEETTTASPTTASLTIPPCLDQPSCNGGPIIACTSMLSNIELLEKSICELDVSGARGVCCPTDPIVNNAPSLVNPIVPLVTLFASTLLSPAQQSALNETKVNAIKTSQQQDEIEQSLIDKGLTVEHDSSEELHNLITFADSGALQLGKKGLAFASGVHTIVNQSSVMPVSILFSQASLENSPVVEACHVPQIECPTTIYRTHDGSCNNMINVDWGKESRGFARLSSATYSDGFSRPRTAVDGLDLTTCRLVSTTLIHDQSMELPHINLLFMGFGQFVDHDLSLTPTTQVLKDGKPTGIQCCTRQANPPHPECMVINIPKDDPFFKPFKQECMGFVRSLSALPPTCSLSPREQMNTLTSYLDGSQIYGPTEVQALILREMNGGRLRVGGGVEGREFPPNVDADRGCVGDVANGLFCFEVGDVRVNEQPLLGLLHTVFLREHNRIAGQLSQMNPSWNEEVLFQETRRIVVGIWQHIIYNEYLPIMLGFGVMTSFDLNLGRTGFSNKYDSNVDATVLNEFATAAFRYGHSLVQSNIQLIGEDGSVKFERLFDRFLKPFNTSLLDSYIRGTTFQASQKVDDNVVTDLTNRLFQRNGKFGLDLAAINCQRGRDHAIGTYTDLRRICGLEPVTSFKDLAKHMDPNVALKFSQVYKDVGDIDLWVGGVVERPIPGAVVGPVFACIIAEQFKRLRFGDRFWFENGDFEWSFKNDQLQQIRQTSLARILCDNSDVLEMQPLALMIPSIWNPVVSCNSSAIPRMMLEPWRIVH